ncbi:MAG TPA: NAD(P)H-dependent oxidoreductase [Candidatus Bathyarchaeia archaeon]|nr:NAD(P)H-dependent oxidoreductase [Candidatus Bathyarchaeia archaeon]
MTKKILVILGHPTKESLNNALADAYIKGVKEADAEVDCLCIRDLKFDPNLAAGYHSMKELEPDLLIAQEKIRWANHIVWIYPTWWGFFPAIMKGFIDRIFIPGFSHKYHKGRLLPERLLKKKTVRIITTMDGCYWIYNLLLRPGIIALKTTMRFVGIKPKGVTAVDQVRKKSEARLEKILLKIKKLGQKLK